MQPAAGTPPEALSKERYQLAMLERDYPAAERFLREIPAGALPNDSTVANSKLMNEALLAVARGADAATVEARWSRRVKRARSFWSKLPTTRADMASWD